MDDRMDLEFDKTRKMALKVWSDNFPWNQRILKITFVYPFQNKTVQILGNLTLCSCLLLALVTTILKLIKGMETGIEFNILVEMLFQIVAFTIMNFSYLFMVLSKENIHKATILMIRMWSEDKDIQKMKLEYGRLGYYLSNLQAGLILLLLMSFGTSTVAIPSFLTWALPGNRTFEKTLPLHTEFLVNENEYFYHIFAAQLVLIFVYGVLMGSLNYAQCSAVLFIMSEIRCCQYKIEKINEEYNQKMEFNEEIANSWMWEKLKDLIKWHQLCIEYYDLIQKEAYLKMLILLSGSSLVIILAGSAMVILIETDWTGAAKMSFAFFITLCAIVFICIPSQFLKIASEDFYITCCEISGEIYSPKIRRLLLLIMMKSLKPFVLNAGPTVELNLETCTTIIKSSMSYVATFRSVYNSL